MLFLQKKSKDLKIRSIIIVAVSKTEEGLEKDSIKQINHGRDI
jgi:hypothetical protein